MECQRLPELPEDGDWLRDLARIKSDLGTKSVYAARQTPHSADENAESRDKAGGTDAPQLRS